MATGRRERFVRLLVTWMLSVVLLLSLLDALSLELVFVGSFVGLLVVAEYTAPFSVTPRWRTRLRVVIVVGLVVFVSIVVRRVLQTLPEGVI